MTWIKLLQRQLRRFNPHLQQYVINRVKYIRPVWPYVIRYRRFKYMEHDTIHCRGSPNRPTENTVVIRTRNTIDNYG